MADLKLPYPKFIDYAVPGNKQCGGVPSRLAGKLREILPADDRKCARLKPLVMVAITWCRLRLLTRSAKLSDRMIHKALFCAAPMSRFPLGKFVGNVFNALFTTPPRFICDQQTI